MKVRDTNHLDMSRCLRQSLRQSPLQVHDLCSRRVCNFVGNLSQTLLRTLSLTFPMHCNGLNFIKATQTGLSWTLSWTLSQTPKLSRRESCRHKSRKSRTQTISTCRGVCDKACDKVRYKFPRKAQTCRGHKSWKLATWFVSWTFMICVSDKSTTLSGTCRGLCRKVGIMEFGL